MNKIKRQYEYPPLTGCEIISFIILLFGEVHSSDNISEEGQRGREGTIVENEQLLLQDKEKYLTPLLTRWWR